MAELLEATSAQIRDIIGLPETAIKLGPIFSVIESGTVLDIGESGDAYITFDSVTTSIIVKKVLDLNTVNKIINLADPTLAQDAATKAFVDAQIATVGGPEFSDALFRINDNVDPTKQIAFQASVITTGTVRTITVPDSDVRLVNTPDGQILDVNVDAHVSTKITINAKGQLNSAIVYNDQTNVFGDFNQDFKDDRLRIFNATDSFAYTFVAAALAFNVNLNLPLLTVSDNIVTEAFSQPLTNKTINLTNNTLEDTADAQGDLIKHNGTKFVRFGVGTPLQQIRVNAGGTDLEYFTEAAGTGTLNLVRLEGVDIAPNRAALNFLDSGTIDFSVVDDGANNEAEISAVVTSGSIGNVEIAAHTSTQITIVNKAQLNSAIVYDDVVNSFLTNAWQFGSGILQVNNPANSFQYIFAGSAITVDRTVTLPLLTGNDTFLMQAFSQTVTNKIFPGINPNEFENDGLVIQNPSNNRNYTILSSNIASDRNLSLPLLLSSDTFVTEDHIQTLINKAINTNTTFGTGITVASSLGWANNVRQTFSPGSNAGINVGQRVSDPAVIISGDIFYQSTSNEWRGAVSAVFQTFVFEDVIQTLTNKTIDGDNNTIIDINETQMNVSVGASGTVLTSTGVGNPPTYQAPAGAAPFPDTTSIVEGSADDTKQIRFEVDGLTTATIRVITAVDADITLVNTPNGQIIDANIDAHVSTKITINAKGQLNSALVYNDQANTFGDFAQTFQDNQFFIRNPADTASYQFIASAIAGDIAVTLPILTVNTEFVFADFANVWGAFNQNIAASGQWQEAGIPISPIGPQDAPLTASFFQDRATDGTAPPGGIQTRELPTNDVNIHFFEFTNAGGVQAIQGQTMLPRNFDNTNVTVFIYWTAESGTGNVAWRVRLLFRSNDDPLDAAFGAETEIVDTFIVANDTHVSGSAVLTVAGSADNDFVIAQVERNPGAANDTFTGDAQFLGMKIVPTLDAAIAA